MADGGSEEEEEVCKGIRDLFGPHKIQSPKHNEMLPDSSHFTVYVIDNSKSMKKGGGKIWKGDNVEEATRWEELKYNTEKIALYNIKRGQHALYYILRPKKKHVWIEYRDKVFIPGDGNVENIKLVARLFEDHQIRGNTPLTEVTQHITNECRFLSKDVLVCYVILTDGYPNNSETFEAALHDFLTQNRVFLTIVLCCDDPDVISYYNKVDEEMEESNLLGCDIIDDWEAESREVAEFNPWLCYSQDIHMVRSAGLTLNCFDELDEEPLPPQDLHRFIKKFFPDVKFPSIEMLSWPKRKKYQKLLKKAVEKRGKSFDVDHQERYLLDVNYCIKRIFPKKMLPKQERYVLPPPPTIDKPKMHKSVRVVNNACKNRHHYHAVNYSGLYGRLQTTKRR